MSKFHVGQRVRIIKSDHGFVGRTATIVGPFTPAAHNRLTGKRWQGWPIDVDGIGNRLPATGQPIAAGEDRIEPIRDDDQLSTWEQVRAVCGWKPSMVTL